MRVDYQAAIDQSLGFEQAHIKEHMHNIAGMDEVGRGPLAGPVVTVCAIMDRTRPVLGVRDSKKVSEKKRGELFPLIEQACVEYAVAFVDNERIDEINILNATRQAFVECVGKLKTRPDFLFVDQIDGLQLEGAHLILPQGDSKSYCIGCASILAKVIRDDYMRQMDKRYPEYHFARNKGYGTAEHIRAIRQHGACPLHRQSFIGNFL